jgi:SRSO17 transposase
LVGVKANLSSYLDRFQTEFKVGSFNQRDNAYRYLQGSLKGQTGKRNIQRISEQNPTDSYQSLHHFITHSNWDTDSIKVVLQEINKELLAGHSYGYIIDERSKSKKGKESAGVARQYCGSTGKIDNCQTGVYSVLTTGDLTLPCNFRLFLPQNWTSDRKRSKKVGLASADCFDNTKVDLALDMIKRDRQNGINPHWYGADSLYGRAWKLTSYIEDECQSHFVMDTFIDHQIYLCDPTDKRRKPITIGQYMQGICLSKAKRVKYQGNKKARVHIVEVFTRNTTHDKTPRKRLLIISRGLSKNDKVKFSLTNFTLSDKTPAQLVFMQRARFTVEQYFRESSQVAGMGDYQVRSFHAWKHVQILSMLLMQLLNSIRKKMFAKQITLSIIAIARCVGPILLRIKNYKQVVFNILQNCSPVLNSS